MYKSKSFQLIINNIDTGPEGRLYSVVPPLQMREWVQKVAPLVHTALQKQDELQVRITSQSSNGVVDDWGIIDIYNIDNFLSIIPEQLRHLALWGYVDSNTQNVADSVDEYDETTIPSPPRARG